MLGHEILSKSTNGKTSIRVSKQLITFWFDHLNKLIFDEKIKRFRHIHTIPHDVEAWAQCELTQTETYCLYVCDLHIQKIFPSLTVFIIALAHEMVHAYNWQVDHDDTFHGKSFYLWTEKFAMHGIPLEKTTGDVWRIVTERTPLKA